MPRAASSSAFVSQSSREIRRGCDHEHLGSSPARLRTSSRSTRRDPRNPTAVATRSARGGSRGEVARLMPPMLAVHLLVLDLRSTCSVDVQSCSSSSTSVRRARTRSDLDCSLEGGRRGRGDGRQTFQAGQIVGDPLHRGYRSFTWLGRSGDASVTCRRYVADCGRPNNNGPATLHPQRLGGVRLAAEPLGGDDHNYSSEGKDDVSYSARTAGRSSARSVAAGATVALVTVLTIGAGTGAAASTAAPVNTSPPTITRHRRRRARRSSATGASGPAARPTTTTSGCAATRTAAAARTSAAPTTGTATC